MHKFLVCSSNSLLYLDPTEYSTMKVRRCAGTERDHRWAWGISFFFCDTKLHTAQVTIKHGTGTGLCLSHQHSEECTVYGFSRRASYVDLHHSTLHSKASEHACNAQLIMHEAQNNWSDCTLLHSEAKPDSKKIPKSNTSIVPVVHCQSAEWRFR